MALKQPKKKKKSSIGIVIVVVIIICLVGAGAYMVLVKKKGAQTEQRVQQEQTQENDSENLSSEQKKLYDTYNSDTKKVITTLQETNWTDNKQVNSVSFSDCAYVEQGENGAENKKYFVVCNISSTNSKDSADTTVTTITCLDNNGQYFNFVLTLSNVVLDSTNIGQDSTSADKKIYTLECDKFSKSQTYIQQNAAKELSISIADDLMSVVPFEKQTLVNEINKYIKEKYPAVTKFVFSAEYYVVLLPTKAYTLYGTCNNSNATELQITYNESDNSFNIGKRKTL